MKKYILIATTFIFIFLLWQFFFRNNNNSNKKINFVLKINVDSISKIDFINYKYKNLNSQHKITLNKDSFQATINKYNYKSSRLNSYKDSLNVALMNEFDNWDMVRVAALQINYTWHRVGLHIWKTESEIKKIATELSFNSPFLLMQFLKNNDSSNSRKNNLLKELKTKLSALKIHNLDSLNNEELIKISFKNNPEVIQKKQKYLHHHGENDEH